MELFVIIVNGFQPLTIIKKSSSLDVAAVLDLPVIYLTKRKFLLLQAQAMVSQKPKIELLN